MNVMPDFDALIKALEDRNREIRYFLDRKSGDVVVIDAKDSQRAINIAQKIKAEPSRFVQIPRMPPEELFKDMKVFADSGKNKKLAEHIKSLIQGGATYRDFRDLLNGFPGEKERWYSFRKERMMLRAKNWLKVIGLDI
ncbi:MAG: hypothetical protein J7M18_02875 [Candidatus Eremiobacteraeota bacterium]|nr:hypothetical protein [Candidatus Eremiobacteraeota bacterium]